LRGRAEATQGIVETQKGGGEHGGPISKRALKLDAGVVNITVVEPMDALGRDGNLKEKKKSQRGRLWKRAPTEELSGGHP